MKSIKIKLVAALLMLMCTSHGYSDVVTDIVIKGNERVNSETIKIFGKIKIGQNLEEKNLNQILKNLYETNFFENVKITLDETVLIINLVENPIIQNLIINGIENKTLKKNLIENISLKEKNPYIESEIKSNLRNIENILQEVGFYFSKVETLKKQNDNNTIDLVFEIDLGKKASKNFKVAS